MKLLIHIGTQKTATTSIQHFCVHNRRLLKSHGYLYPKNDIHPFLFNFLPEQLARGEQDRVAEYLQKVCLQAQREKCHTAIISAESFYAMSFYYLYPKDESRPAEYWQIEARLVEQLHRCCDGFDEVKVVCYLRPQDDYAAAFYNQLVKITPYFIDTYKEFMETVKPIFDYERHIRLWEKSFGADSISIGNFSGCTGDIVEDFFERFLDPETFSQASKLEYRSNMRLNRDVLEFKKIFNKTNPGPPLSYIGGGFHTQINSEFADQPGYQVFADLDYRNNFFGPYSDGNKKLAERYGLGELPVVVNEQDPTYPGLDTAKAFEIDSRLQYLLNKPGTRIKLALHKTEILLTRRLPGLKRLMSRVRLLRNRLKSRRSKH